MKPIHGYRYFMALSNCKDFQPKELQESIGKWYSVALSDETVERNGKLERAFYVSKGSSLLTAEYITSLLRNAKSLVELPLDVQSHVRADNNIKIWYHLYAINSDLLMDTISSNILGSKQENISGRAGNVSRAYFTPFYNPVCLAAMNGLGIDSKSKLISTYQFDLLNKIEAYIIMDNDSDGSSKGILLNGKPKLELDAEIAEYVKDGYTPVRLLFENLPPEQSNLFNVKPISDIITNEVDAEIAKYFKSKKINARKISAYEINSTYNISLSDAFSSRLSNHRFWCTVKDNGDLDEIFLIPQKQLYFGFTKRLDDGFHFETNSFVSKHLNKKEGLISIPATNKKGEHYEIEIVEIDLYRILEWNNYGELRTINSGRPKEFKIDLYNYLIVKNGRSIKEAIKKAVRTSRIQSDNESDQNITALLKSACELKDSTFNLIQSRVAHSSLEDIRINYKERIHSDVSFVFEERQVKNVLKNNDTCIMHYVSLHKNNLAYEREKVLTALFVEHAIRYLKSQGHSNIKVEFERKVQKQDKSIGYLDLILTSSLAGEKYGQVFEFKAWSLFGTDAFNKLKTQCDSYKIQNMMDRRNVIKTYTNEPVNEVKGINLKFEHVQLLVGNSVPWLPNNSWPSFSADMKKTAVHTNNKSINTQSSSLPKPYKGVPSLLQDNIYPDSVGFNP